MNILLQSYISKAEVDGFALVADMNHVVQARSCPPLPSLPTPPASHPPTQPRKPTPQIQNPKLSPCTRTPEPQNRKVFGLNPAPCPVLRTPYTPNQSAGRIFRALFELCVKKGFVTLANKLLTLNKVTVNPKP